MERKFYVSFVFLICIMQVNAQSPGGVSSNLKLWVKSNSGTSTTTNGSPLSTWTYANDGSKQFASAVGQEPSFTTSGLNFLPVVTFGGVQWMDGPTGVDAPITAGDDDYSLIVVWRSNFNAFSRVWSQRKFGASNAADGFSLATWNNNLYGDQVEVSPYSHTIIGNYTTGLWYVSELNVLNQPLSDLEVTDNTSISTGPVIANTDPSNTNGPALRNLTDQVNRLGARDDFDEALSGDIAEVIVYDNPLNTVERNEIFSYLALKYGINLKTNFVSSGNSTIWDATANSAYNFSVFGLGRDDNSALNVSESNSIETGSGDGTGQSGKGNIVLSNPSSLDNNDFLIIGNDNGTLSEITTDLPPAAAGSERVGREWKVQHTGNIGTVSLDFDRTGLTLTGTNLVDYRLMVDEDGDGDFTTGTTRYYTPTSFMGNVANFAGITLNNNEVFTFITGSSNLVLPVNWLNFGAKLKGNDVYLNWGVDGNGETKSYSIEHSLDGVSFSEIGSIQNVSNVKNYSFIHKNVAAGNHYYRIKELDLTGRITYSKVVSITSKLSDISYYIISNPVRNNIAQLVVNTSKATHLTVDLISIYGAKISSVQYSLVKGNNYLNIDMTKLSPGNYLIRIDSEQMTLQSLKVVKL